MTDLRDFKDKSQNQLIEYAVRMRKERDAAFDRVRELESAAGILEDGLYIDGGHHKQWHIEQALRLMGRADVADANDHEPGIAP